MDIRPGARGQAAVWHHSEPGLETLGVWTEKRSGLGEDAEPLVVYRRSSARGLVAVFDGVGGAGAAVAGVSTTGTEHTNAWVAARAVRGLTEEWFALGLPTADLAPRLAQRLGSLTGADHSRVRGTMRRVLPTTLAAIDFRLLDRTARWTALWAGDSRCYVAEPRAGLAQLSRDDAEGGDALALLTQDPPMTNMISGDGRFRVRSATGSSELPCLLLAATDGFFGYVDTPARFEHVLLDTLMSAQDGAHWSAMLTEWVVRTSGDDASLGLAALGFEDFADLRARFRTRAHTVRARHIDPYSPGPTAGQAAEVAAREGSWHRYRGDYERFSPPAVETR